MCVSNFRDVVEVPVVIRAVYRGIADVLRGLSGRKIEIENEEIASG